MSAHWTRTTCPAGLAIFFAVVLQIQAGEPNPPRSTTTRPQSQNTAILAHWTFDQPDHPERRESSEPVTSPKTLTLTGLPSERTAGLYGDALQLSGKHRVSVRAITTPSLSSITFSVWVKPTELSGYRELFRQECPERVLFSFQNNGTILSLGLNIDGYVECDAHIEPVQVLDGAWHHCAASYDGDQMRVFLDGRQIA